LAFAGNSESAGANISLADKHPVQPSEPPPMSPRVIITLLIIAGIGIGTGALVFGLTASHYSRSDDATITAMGSAILASSLAALVAHLSGGFRDLERRDDDL